MKCHEKHDLGECARKKDDGSEPCCVNCGESGHPANWRGCSSYKKYVVTRKDRINEARDKQAVATKNVSKIFHTSKVNLSLHILRENHPSLMSF